MTLRLGWFSSGNDEGAIEALSAVLSQIGKGALDASVSFAFCNWELGDEAPKPEDESRQRFFELARSNDIPLVALSWQKIRESWSHDPAKDWRVCFGKKMRTLLYERPFELGVLFGYSQPLDADSCTRFDLIMMNPSLGGLTRIGREAAAERAIAARDARHGATMHICAPGERVGPAVTYCSFALDVAGRPPLLARIVQEERRREAPLVTYTIKLFADGDLDIVNGRLLAEGMATTSALDVSRAVDASIQQGQL